MVGVIVTVENIIEYFWVSVHDKSHDTHNTYFISDFKEYKNKKRAEIPYDLTSSHVICKITAYVTAKKPDNTSYFSNHGTVLFEIRLNSETDLPCYRERYIDFQRMVPNKTKTGEVDSSVAWEFCQSEKTSAVLIQNSTLGCVFNICDSYTKEAKTIFTSTRGLCQQLKDAKIKNCSNNLIGFIRNSEYDFDMPFCMPGAVGIQFMRDGIYGLRTWIQMVYLSCSLCGFKQSLFDVSSPIQKQSTLCALSIIAMGSTWSSGYEYEEIDDTSPTWSSLGSTKDCEDFTITFVSIAEQLLTSTRFSDKAIREYISKNPEFQFLQHIALQMTKFIRTNFEFPCMLCGWIKNMHNDANVELEGHAWGGIYFKPLNEFMYVECTSPVLPSAQNDTTSIHSQIYEIYGGAITSPMSSLSFCGDTYGPARFQPLDRYVAVSVMYTKELGYYLSNKGSNRIGIQSPQFLKNNFTKNPFILDSPETQAKMQKFKDIDLIPDFTDALLWKQMEQILTKNEINTISTTEESISKTMTKRHNLNFFPSVYIPTKIIDMGMMIQPIEKYCTVDTIAPLPYATGAIFYVMPLKMKSDAFVDTVVTYKTL